MYKCLKINKYERLKFFKQILLLKSSSETATSSNWKIVKTVRIEDLFYQLHLWIDYLLYFLIFFAKFSLLLFFFLKKIPQTK